jgi:CBS domain containing-hemolysin-like protein
MVELQLVVLLVLVTSAICSLFEAVLYSIPATFVEQLEQSGRPAGRILKQMKEQVDRPITAILSLNTISNTGGGALAGALAAGALGGGNVIYFSILFTLAILLFAEVVPKTIGVVYARPLAPLIARPMHLLVGAFQPLIGLVQIVTKLIRKGHKEQPVSDADLLTLVVSGLRSGTLNQDEARVIENVLSMDTRTVKQVMTPRPVVFTLAARTSAREAVSEDAIEKYSRIPVFGKDPDDLVGVVRTVDILTAMANDRFDVKMEEIKRPIHFVIDSTRLDDLLRTFLKRRQHLVAVIDEFGGVSGIVTLEDVLEELIGREIVDESDQVTDLRAYAQRRREDTLNRVKKLK